MLDSLESFTKLTSLVVDSNQLISHQERLPTLAHLTTLSVNDNAIDDLDVWLTCVAARFPNLTFLSMLKNPACPNYFIGKDAKDYARYRLFVLHRLPGLKFLDSSPVTASERAEAKRVGHLMRVARPVAKASPPSSKEAPSLLAGDDDDDDDGGNDAGVSGVDGKDGGVDDDEDVDEVDLTPGKGKVTFGVSRYFYQGKQSEGNRFITNGEL